ncbi:MAG: glycosyltransferase, partial [Helicobacteraceae bacterium]|nr:glycosyltransferase [Helicobacteraceae bacterium]
MSEKIVFFSSALTRGGAERQLVALAKELKKRRRKIVVVAYDRGVFDNELTAAGVEIYYANRRGVFGILGFLFRAAKLLRSLKPTIVYSFLGTPNIYAVLFKPFLRGVKIVWGIRASNIDAKSYGIASRFAEYLETLFSRFPDLIVANSNAGRELCIKKGFPKDKIVVVENGIDTERFNYDPKGAKRVR